MDSKINFFKIGIFIILFIILLLSTIFWLGKYGFEQKKFDEYSVYFKESISGLSVGSSIKYKGFEVGNVHEIKINPNNSEEIKIDILIKKGTPIKVDNYAILGNLGITGLKYIELKGGTQNSPILAENKQGIKVINSQASDLVSFFDSTHIISQKFMKVLNQIDKVLNNQNIDRFSNILIKSEKSATNIEQLTQYLVKNEKKIDQLLENISHLVDTSNNSFKSVNSSAKSFKELSNEFLKELKDGKFDIENITSESLDNLDEVLNSLNETVLEAENLLHSLEESPSDLFLKQKKIQYGPGEIDEK
ncbi:MlaD family protein [Arcobacter sp. 15-2]|uniref:MlaD family protein n=1 Tax=Arcobacter sp. 15-2 TaxID=3374109 RepID=UPI00399D0803